jgi:hypothetical protein
LKADQIRAVVKALRKEKDGNSLAEQEELIKIHLVTLIGEVAAQLADLNEKIAELIGRMT